MDKPLNEDDLQGLELQCGEIAQELTRPGSEALLHETVPPGFISDVEKLIAEHQALKQHPIPADVQAKIDALYSALQEAYGMLNKVARMESLRGNREAALAAKSFLNVHPLPEKP